MLDLLSRSFSTAQAASKLGISGDQAEDARSHLVRTGRLPRAKGRGRPAKGRGGVIFIAVPERIAKALDGKAARLLEILATEPVLVKNLLEDA